MKGLELRIAQCSQLGAIERLLKVSGLPDEDIRVHITDFVVALVKDEVVGVAGLELLGRIALFRSLAVDAGWRSRGIATSLYGKISAYARKKGIVELYLLTTTERGFFNGLGFREVSRDDIAESVRATKEFSLLCPKSAVCMKKYIGEGAEHYIADNLRFEEDVKGARMWSVALESTMMTCFKVEPYCRFETHSHESEQITMVLEGEIFFETGEGITRVMAGEVFAIPGNLPHAAFTGEKGVKAVDAWSPVMEKYRRPKRL